MPGITSIFSNGTCVFGIPAADGPCAVHLVICSRILETMVRVCKSDGRKGTAEPAASSEAASSRCCFSLIGGVGSFA
jgi:hypothetical protein